LEKEMNLVVERRSCYDEDGIVYGYPSKVEVDVALHNEKAVLVEVTSHARASEVYAMKSELYEKRAGRKASRLFIATPYAEGEAIKTLNEL